jgi:hypothetical protein
MSKRKPSPKELREMEKRKLPPKEMWVLLDLDNADAWFGDGGHSYFFGFLDKKDIPEFIKHHKTIKYHTELAGPYKFTFTREGEKK